MKENKLQACTSGQPLLKMDYMIGLVIIRVKIQ
jgi:hypothetical protein